MSLTHGQPSFNGESIKQGWDSGGDERAVKAELGKRHEGKARTRGEGLGDRSRGGRLCVTSDAAIVVSDSIIIFLPIGPMHS